jgi:hypothetical protein
MSTFPIPPYGERECPGPPYNATNFTPPTGPPLPPPYTNQPTNYSTLTNYAVTMPNYPWKTGTDAQQIFRSQQNVTYFNNVNQKTALIKEQNALTGAQQPYPQFKSETERLMYRQGQALTAARNVFRNQNPLAPGVPCYTTYQIINGQPPFYYNIVPAVVSVSTVSYPVIFTPGTPLVVPGPPPVPGTFTITAGPISINSTTGEITIPATTTGSYTVTYTVGSNLYVYSFTI